MYGWNATLKSIFINSPVTAVKKYNSFALPPQHSYPGVAGYDFCSFGKKATPPPPTPIRRIAKHPPLMELD